MYKMQKELSRLVTDDQITVVVRNFLYKQQFRLAAQVVERIGGKLAGRPDLLLGIWNDQRVGVYQVYITIHRDWDDPRDILV